MINTVEHLADTAVKKCAMRPQSRFVGGMLAGAYVGVAILLIFSVGSQVPVPFRALVMGASFGLALVLVVTAGAELFTGYVLYFGFACSTNKTNAVTGVLISASVWMGNFLGAIFLVSIYWFSEGYLLKVEGAGFLQSVAAKKMSLSPSAAFARGMLCNWLVCLALWCAKRVDSDAARILIISWCLMAFIASGFEHSVANMTVHVVSLIGPSNPSLSVGGAAHNLFWVSLGNIAGALLMVVLPYAYQHQCLSKS